MPKPVQRVSRGRPKQAVFAASIKQFPKRLVILTEGASWFSYPLNSNIADYLEMMSGFSMLPVDALFLSAGGNDLVAGELARLTTVLDDIVAAYSRLLDARDALRPKCVVVAHSYCYFQPTGRKATGPFGLLKAGPWMQPVLAAKGIDLVDMRSALPVDDVNWADEIHPSGTGFRKLADSCWRPVLKARFPGRGFD